MSRLDNRIKREQANAQFLPDSPNFQSELAQQYEKEQIQAQEEYQKQLKLAEVSNPHTLYTDIVSKPSPVGKYKMIIKGRPVDVNALEQYLIFKISPRTITTLMRYNDSKSVAEIQGYGRRPQVRASKGIGLLILVGVGALLAIGVGYLFLNGTIPNMMQGMFGGFVP